MINGVISDQRLPPRLDETFIDNDTQSGVALNQTDRYVTSVLTVVQCILIKVTGFYCLHIKDPELSSTLD